MFHMESTRRRRAVLAILIMFGLTLLSCGSAKRPQIALFTPRAANDAFWSRVANFMGAACDDLGMDLTVYYANDSRTEMEKQILEAARSGNVDALVFQNFKEGGAEFLKIAEATKVPAFLINAGVGEDLGAPRQQLQYWIGQMTPNDEGAGYDLANILIRVARDNGAADADGVVHMVGINGLLADMAALERVKGLKRAVAEQPDVVLHEVVAANWKHDLAQMRFLGLKETYPQTTVVWTASDLMGVGVVDGIEELGLMPNADVFTGGVDWATEGVEMVKQGKMTASLGGHFMEGGWAAVLLHDYFQGQDFASEKVTFRSRMQAITPDNAMAYYDRLMQRNWDSVDFTRFSKVHNPDLKTYQFELDLSE